MSRLIFLGTASAVPDKNHQNTHLVIETLENTILIDCVGNPVTRLDEARINPLTITDLILTHFHPDHVSAVPLLLMDLWLMGRVDPINVFALHEDIEKLKKILGIFDWETWEGMFLVNFHNVPKENSILINTSKLKVWASLVCHMIPAIGLRFEWSETTLCYSADTGPCDAVVQLAKEADILIHEATGESEGHSSPEQAGEIAQKAGAKSLYLVHYPVGSDLEELNQQASKAYSGEVIVAKDLMSIEF